MDKIMIITGNASGIGRALQQAYQGKGWTLFTVDKSESSADHHHFQGDLADADTVPQFCRFVTSKTDRVDVLINNAAVMVRTPPEKLPLEEWERVLKTNLTAPFLLTRELAPLLRKGLGRVINLTSTRAHMSEPNTESYSASKGGLLALTHAMAVSLGPDIKVNCISPGWIDTSDESLSEEDHSQHPAGRVGTTADLVGLVDYLTDSRTEFVTGSEFVIDGGMTRKMIYQH
jgi:NAD(P)-dependent dehydrogenase (short-subunit alcohol dehydrogenase family)